MARLNTINVVVVIGGILSDIYSFDNTTEAEDFFKNLIRIHGEDYSEDDMEAYTDNGHFEEEETDIYLSHANMASFTN